MEGAAGQAICSRMQRLLGWTHIDWMDCNKCSRKHHKKTYWGRKLSQAGLSLVKHDHHGSHKKVMTLLPISCSTAGHVALLCDDSCAGKRTVATTGTACPDSNIYIETPSVDALDNALVDGIVRLYQAPGQLAKPLMP